MSFKYVQEIPLAAAITGELPLSPELASVKRQRDAEIIDVFTRKSGKFLLIIGPCSADNEDAVCAYVSKLAALQEKVKEKIVLIPRIYTNKPRTTGEGYKGMVHQPDPTEDPNIVEGIKAIRKMHLRALRESHLTASDEMLYPTNYPYLEDILSYVAIGARSVENQQHRLTVSGLDIPCGMKNPTSGDITVMLNSVQAAQLLD
jgi:3-deoxy-7-phosphoheptulonate synthase